MEEEKQVLIKGERIQLRTAVRADMELKVRWYNDPDVNKTLVLPEKLELQKTYEWFERARQSDSRHDWVIELLDGKAIGVVGVKEINKNNKSGLLYIVIGDKDYWGKGLGYEAELLAIHYCFKHLKLHRVLGAALENNPASIAVINKVGFHQDGTFRDEYFANGRYYNLHRYSILEDEFYHKHPEFKTKT
jgi:RimJ/RimL family protein N-acetyltransferase